MFESARIKLTGWYTLIIFIISALFSVGVYRVATNELRQGMHVQAFKMLPRHSQDELLNKYPELGDVIIKKHLPLMYKIPVLGIAIDDNLYQDTKRRIAFQLILINTGIVMAGAVISYFLAGRTLVPLEAAVEEQKRFVSDASHELRTPLTSLKTEIEVALRDKKMKLDDAKKLLKSNLEEVNKMQSLSNYLLSLNKYESGTLHLPFEKVNVKEIIDHAVKKLSPQAKERKITIEKELIDVTIKGNAMSLVELFSILIDNAIKYSKDGGQIMVRNFSKGKQAVVEVQDFGMGITEEDIPHIFDRFYRADQSRCKTETDGYGLGLAIAKSIVDLYGGTIEVKSKTEKSTTFIVKI